jgi:hypothetical protein
MMPMKSTEMDYAAYMASNAWQEHRRAYFDAHHRGRRCCDETNGLHLHHLSCHTTAHSHHEKYPALSLRAATNLPVDHFGPSVST